MLYCFWVFGNVLIAHENCDRCIRAQIIDGKVQAYRVSKVGLCHTDVTANIGKCRGLFR